jgi:hypothetical protein
MHMKHNEFWRELIAYFPFSTGSAFHTIRSAWEKPRPTALRLRVISLQRERCLATLGAHNRGTGADSKAAL